MSSDYPNLLPALLPVDPNPLVGPLHDESLQIIAQPCYTSKLRYRSDYEKNQNRRGVLRSRNNPNHRSPAIRIPQVYRDITQQYYIRVSLVTVENERTNCRYLHPYELEDIDFDDYNDRQNKAVWYPIQGGDTDETKSFPSLRIVRRKADDLIHYGNFRVFDVPDSPSVPQLSSTKETIREFNLYKSQLAFTIGQKIIQENHVTYIAFSGTTVFSEELIEIVKETESDNTTTESTAGRSHTSKSANCQMHKYAPRSGYTDSNDEILIFFTNKIKPRKYGDLEVTFEYDSMDGHWSEPVLDLEVKDQMVSFRTPRFPFPIDSVTTVTVLFKQRRRTLQPLTFNYIPIVQCPQCQRNAITNPISSTQTNPNKRRHSDLYPDDEVTDDVTPVYTTQESNPALLRSISEDPTEQMIDKLADGIASLFSNKDFQPVLRICRAFIRKNPELLHQAIDNNYSDLIPKFISVAGIELLQRKNQFGETVLLHAARLNRVDIVKALLERKNSDKLIDDTNDKKQNIFHILALNKNADLILNLFIDYLLKKSINIQKKFDRIDIDNHTPLQIAIKNNNLPVTRHFLKYFDKNVYKTSTDNLIHLAVRYTDMTMLKYLLNEGQLIEQGNQSNFSMTPIELARTMKHDDMVEYFKKIYPQPEVDKEGNSGKD